MDGVAVVVFSDLVDSTSLLARLGDDRMEEIRRAHVVDVRRAVHDGGGVVVKTLGDGVMASFDSALGALQAAAAIQDSVEHLRTSEEAAGLAARVGVAAGEPIREGADMHGMPVVIASRLCAVAASGDVLVHSLVGGLVASRHGVGFDDARSFALKGVPDAVDAASLRWRTLLDGPALVVGGGGPPPRAAPAAPPLPRGLAAFCDQPVIGRDEELSELRAAASAAGGRRAVVILGEPGIGKTLLAAKAAAEAHERGGVVVLARCPPEPAIAFEPWVRAIGELALGGDERWRAGLARCAGPQLAGLVPELSAYAAAN